jgi:CheY-like chemotaxis protein
MNVPVDGVSALRVLVVDDDADQRMVAVRLLRQHGIDDVTEAASADDGVAAAAGGQPHLVLLDLAMPGRSGYDALPDLVSAAPTAVVVVLSNLPRQRLEAPVRERGAVGFVEKRTPPDRLVDEILMAAALTDLARDQVLRLPSGLASPAAGRRFVRHLLADAELSLVADVELLVSELISNAVIHTSSEPRLVVRINPATVHVAVYDAAADLPTLRSPEAAGPGGRGLHIVAALATRWGTHAEGNGKVVWFEIDRQSQLASTDSA